MPPWRERGGVITLHGPDCETALETTCNQPGGGKVLERKKQMPYETGHF